MNGIVDWKPTPLDIAWTRREVIEKSNQPRTLWGVPFNNSWYLIDRVEKKLTLLNGPEMGPRGNLFEQLRVILKNFGYTVQHRPIEGDLPAEIRAIFNEKIGTVPQPDITIEMTDKIYGKGKTHQQPPTNP